MAEVENTVEVSTVEVVAPVDLLESKTELSPFDSLKTVLSILNEHMAKTKTLATYVRATMKAVDRQTKDLDKLRNKSSRAKTERKNNGVQSGITKPVPISEELAVFLGVAPGTMVPRNEVTKGVSAYVHKHELSDPTNRQKFILDTTPEGLALKKLLGNPTDPVTYFNLQRYLKHHYIFNSVQLESGEVPVAESVNEPVAESVNEPVAESVNEPFDRKQHKKKLILRKKNGGSELKEEA